MSATMELTTAIPGASDQDRDAWLAERRTGITATEIKELYLGKKTIAKLVALKLGREKDTFSGNALTRWGNERESVIAEQARRRFGMEPESRVFHAADEFRFLASPDGMGQGFDGLEIAEYKTAGRDIAPGTTAYEETGYFIQKVWAMRVLGARRCLYGAEDRITVPGGFEAGGLRFWWIDWDAAAQALAVRLEALAREFLAALDKAASEDWEQPEIDDELDTLGVNYIRFRDMESEGKRAKEAAGAQIKALLADRASFSQESTLARITWTRGGESTSTVESRVVDVEAAKLTRGDLAAKLHAATRKAESAQRALDKVQAEWQVVLDSCTTTVIEQVVRPVRENLTITAPRTMKETKK